MGDAWRPPPQNLHLGSPREKTRLASVGARPHFARTCVGGLVDGWYGIVKVASYNDSHENLKGGIFTLPLGVASHAWPNRGKGSLSV